MRKIVRYKWSLVSIVSTAVNCLVIYLAKLYEPPSTGRSLPPTLPTFAVLYHAEVFLSLFAVFVAIGGMFRREPATYTRLAFGVAFCIGVIGNVALTMHA